MTEQLQRLTGPAETLAIAHRRRTHAPAGAPVLITEAGVVFGTEPEMDRS